MLSDLKIVELASVLAGPNVGQFFAELGAEVIKVENLPGGGDVTRSWRLTGEETDDRSAYFCCTNWGKKSIAIDLTSEEGKQIVWDLIKRADIVIVSYKPGDAARLGVDYETLSSLEPTLIYGQITGYGPRDSRVGYDAVIQAESGFMHLNGEPGGNSLKMPVALMDILAGHQLKEGLLVALLERERTGKGKLVNVSIIESAIASLANQASNWLIAGRKPKKHGTLHPNIAPYGEVFKTSDDKEILLAVGNDRQFRDLCYILELNEAPADPKFQTNELRLTYRGELDSLLGHSIGKLDSGDLVGKLRAAKVPAGLIAGVDEVLAGPSGKSLLIELNGLRGVRTFVAGEPSALAAPPHLGEHTHLVLSELLGYSMDKVNNLRLTRIIY